MFECVYLIGAQFAQKTQQNENNHCILIKEESMYAFKVENVSHDNILTTKDCNWLVTFSNTEKRVENTTHSRVFLTNLEVSHCRNSGERKGKEWNRNWAMSSHTKSNCKTIEENTSCTQHYNPQASGIITHAHMLTLLTTTECKHSLLLPPLNY